MDNNTTISRREFLKWFAAISITSVGGVSCICIPVTYYGPPPMPDPMVAGMAYLDKSGSERPLHGSTKVPLDAQFVIRFSEWMDTSTQESVFLSLAQGGEVEIETAWIAQDALKITLQANLQPDTMYLLEVAQGSAVVNDDPLLITDAAQATFTTVE